MSKKNNKKRPISIEWSEFWSNGSISYRRDCLSANHPEQTYNHLKTKYPNVNLEDFGIYHPVVGNLDDIKDIKEAKAEIAKLRKEVYELNDILRGGY